MAKIKITRILVITGEEAWVRATCDDTKTLVSTEKPFITPAGTIVETSRVEEPFNG